MKTPDVSFLFFKEQIETRGIKDPNVLCAMKKVRRELFVPENMVVRAYEDNPLPIGKGQTISQPYIVAFMTEALNLKKNEKVLEIGTGSGYQTAILAEIVKEVYTVEIICELANKAGKRFEKLGYENIRTICANGYNGWKEHAPYDAVIVTAAPDHIPKSLVEQLRTGGRMVIPVGSHFQELMCITKTKESTTEKRLLPVRFVSMTGDF